MLGRHDPENWPKWPRAYSRAAARPEVSRRCKNCKRCSWKWKAAAEPGGDRLSLCCSTQRSARSRLRCRIPCRISCIDTKGAMMSSTSSMPASSQNSRPTEKCPSRNRCCAMTLSSICWLKWRPGRCALQISGKKARSMILPSLLTLLCSSLVAAATSVCAVTPLAASRITFSPLTPSPADEPASAARAWVSRPSRSSMHFSVVCRDVRCFFFELSASFNAACRPSMPPAVPAREAVAMLACFFVGKENKSQLSRLHPQTSNGAGPFQQVHVWR
mmetsp:Transcript_46189/g.117938  ORF Transcript_46189/g.117938 Transcript_46189/m.117938 type:complete len:274 (+) Transcript_46189:676-1497(+)